jgi:acyl-CoA dehydrogenase
LGRLEYAFKLIKKSEDTEAKVRRAIRHKKMAKIKGPARLDEALAKGIITADEKANLLKAEEVRWDAIQVDDYNETEYHSKGEGVATRPQVNHAYGK